MIGPIVLALVFLFLAYRWRRYTAWRIEVYPAKTQAGPPGVGIRIRHRGVTWDVSADPAPKNTVLYVNGEKFDEKMPKYMARAHEQLVTLRVAERRAKELAR